MAGVMMTGDEGMEIKKAQVPTTDALPYEAVSYAPIADMGHTDSNQFRAEGVNYNSDQSIGVDVTTEAYPAGTAMKDTTPRDDIN